MGQIGRFRRVGMATVRRATRLCGLICVLVPGLATAGEQITFAAFGDYGGGSSDEENVANLVKSWNPDFIITTGDNNYGSIDVGAANWESYIGRYYGEFILGRSDNKYPLQQSSTQRFFPTVGNHDTTVGYVKGLPEGYPAGDKPGYLDYFHTDPALPEGRLPTGVHLESQSFYSFRWGPAHFFSLDSDRAQSDPESMIEQRAWLEAGMLASDAPWKFVYMHHPPYSTGPHGDHALMQWPYQAWGADAVFTGHDHNYERTIVDGIPFFVTGLGGVGIYGFPGQDGSMRPAVRYSNTVGSMRVTLDEAMATFEFVAVPTQVGEPERIVDQFVLRHVPEPALSLVTICAFLFSLTAVHRGQ